MTHTTKSAAYRRRKEAAKEAESLRRAAAREAARAAGPKPRKMRLPKPAPGPLDREKLDRLAERRSAEREKQFRFARRVKRERARREARRPEAIKCGPAKRLQRVTESSGLLDRLSRRRSRTGPRNTAQEDERRRRQAERMNAKRRIP